MSLKFTNNARTLLTANISAVDTTIPVSSTSAFPTISSGADAFYVTISDGTNTEVVYVTGKTGTSFTGCARGVDGTTARAFTSTTPVEQRLNAGALNSFLQLGGGIMAGSLQAAWDASLPYEVVTKRQLDTVTTTANSAAATASNALPLSGGTMTGYITLHSGATASFHPIAKAQLDTILTSYLTVGNFASSLAANGYQYLPSGLLIQWGYQATPNGNYSFPIAFPNVCYVIVAGNADSQGSNVDNSFAYPVSLSQFHMASKSSPGSISAYPTYWIAIGR